ncbi:MAG: VOC family protein [Hyphomicrobiales bacterium]|nr:VOC family protein [Hyphomicrobiales bacterium]
MRMQPQLGHVGIYAFDLEVMEQFYREVLRLNVTDRGMSRSAKAPIVFMSSNPTQHHQFVLVGGRASDAKASTINQLSFKVDSLAELRAVNAEVIARGVAIRPINHGNAWSIYFMDPEGNQIEVYCDTPWHVAQPHGDPLDLSLADEVIVSETERVVRADPTFMTKAAREQELARRWSRSFK